MADIQGTCDERFEAVRSALAKNLDSGEELGASIVVDIDGTTSSTCGAASARGQDDPVGRAHDHQRLVLHQDRDQPGRADAGRPGRARRGRAGREVLARVRRQRQGGRPGPARHVARLRGVRPGPAGRRRGPLRLGAVHLPDGRPGALVGAGHRVGLPRAQLRAPGRRDRRRISGKTLKEFVAEEIAGPLGADFQIAGGKRLGPGRPGGPAAAAPDRPGDPRPGQPGGQDLHRAGRGCQRRQHPRLAAGRHRRRQRHGNARSVARIQSVVATAARSTGSGCSPGNDRRDLPGAVNGVDLVLGVPLRFGIGYGLPQLDLAALHPGREDLLLGRVGRLDHPHGPRPADDGRLHDEQDGAGLVGSDRSAEYVRAVYDAVALEGTP